ARPSPPGGLRVWAARYTRGPLGRPPAGRGRGRGGAERAAAAARLLGAYDVLRRPQQYWMSGGEMARRERTGAAVRAELGDAEYERVHAEGGGLTLDEAVALV
ncbi:hypothetical protein ACFWMG_04345, partial [Streptomyces sp. NPDC127074]|uniref:hypothetical protein n=1 Tax=Streptomyces sp. NPDC127074 TaxID=3347130 RepID=UPI0036645052